MKKKLFSWVTLVALILSLLPAGALAAEPGRLTAPEPQTASGVFTTASSGASVRLFGANTLSGFTTFGDQLTTGYARAIYDALCDPSNLEKIRQDQAIAITLESKSLSDSDEITAFVRQDTAEMFDAARDAVAAFDRDRSDIFWTSGYDVKNFVTQDGRRIEENYYATPGTYTVGIDLTLPITSSWTGSGARSIAEDEATVERQISAVIATVNKSENRYTQLETVHDWLTKNNAYNTAAANSAGTYADHTPWEAISALTGDATLQPVCEGYARAFKLICDELNIPCVLVSGKGITDEKPGGEDHMWNYVQMEDGLWYAVDVTWDDPTVTGGTGSGNVSGHERDTYFLVGGSTPVDDTTTFNVNHIATSNDFLQGGHKEFDYPTLSDTAFDPNKVVVSAVTVSVTAPVTGVGVFGNATVSVPSSGVNGAVQWYEGNTATGTHATGNFKANTVYTAKITLTPTGDQTFANPTAVTMDGAVKNVVPTGNSLVLTKTFPATGDKTVTKIEITAQPTNLKYKEGVSFDTTGMVVTATYNDGSSAPVTGYTVTPDPLTADTTSVTVTYMGHTATVNGLTVLKVPTLDQFDITLPRDAVYDGNDKTAAVTAKNGVTDMGAVTVKYNGETTAPINAGTYTVTFDVAEGGSYAAVTDLSAGEFTIAKATPKIIVTNAITVVKGTGQKLTAAIDPADLTLGFTSADPAIAQVDSTGNVTGVAEGNTTITVAFAGSANYEDVSADVAVTVTGKTPVTVTFADAPSRTYKPEGYNLGAQFTAATVEGDGKTITSYKYDGNTYDTLTELPTVTDAGTYQVTAVYETDTEYGEATASFTITKAEQDALTVTSTGSATYGQNYELTAEGGSSTGEVTFAVTNGTGTADINGSNLVPTQAGDVTVTATKAGDNNYNPVTSAPVTITIDKAPYPNATTASGYVKADTVGYVILPALPDGASYGAVSYGDAATTAAQVADLTVDGVRLSYTGGPNVAVSSTYTLTVAISGGVNYEDATLTVTLTGTDLITPTLTVEPISTTYTGSGIPVSAIKGTATVNDEAVDGTWSWSGANSKVPTDVADSGKEFYVTFTPDDGALYAPADIRIEVTIAKATPTGAPKYTAITSAGKTLADANLTTEGGTFSVPGTAAWDLADTTTVQANASYKWIFTPDDSANYDTLSGTVVLYKVNTNPGGGGGGGGGSSSDDDDDYTPPSNDNKNPDGSTTTTTTTADGTKVETTKYPDGSKEVVETAKDGTVTTTTTDKAGNETKVVEATDGTVTTTLEKTNGSSSTTTVSPSGQVTAQVRLPQSVLDDAAGEAVALPMSSVSASSSRSSAPTVTVDLPAGASAKVEIPVRNVTSGTVAVLVKADGTEEVIKTSLTTQSGVAVTLSDGDTVKIVDNTKTFGDVPASYWGSSAVGFAASRELFTGTGENTFTPDGDMTRGMIVTVLARFDGVDTSTGENWYDAGAQWAIENGISDGTNLDQSLTREQLATMLYRYVGEPAVSGSLTGYPDGSSVSSYAADAMTWAVANGLITGMGDGTLNPQGTATRAQVATILMRFIQANA